MERLLPELGLVGEDTSTATSVPLMALADPSPGGDSAELQAQVANLHSELEGRKRKIEALQNAARRDVETKKKLQEEKTDLEVQVASLQENLREQTERFDGEKEELRRELRDNADQAHQEALQTLEARVAELEELLAEATSEGQTRAEQLEATTTERDELRARLETVSSTDAEAGRRVAELGAELKQAVDERDSLMARVEELDVALVERPDAEAYAKLERARDELEASSAERMAEYAAHIDVLVGEKSELEARLAAADALALQLEEAREELELLGQRLASLPDADEIAEQELELAELRRASRQAELQAHERASQQVEADARFSEFKRRARATFEDLAAEIAALEEELERARAEQAKTLEQLTGLRDEYVVVQEEEERARAAAQRLQEQAEALHGELEGAGERLRDAGEREQELRRELAERPLPDKVEALEQGAQRLKATVQQLEEELTQQELDGREHAKQARRLSQEVDSLRERLTERDALVEELQANVARLQKLEEDHRRLRDELEQAPSDDELSALRAKLEQAREALSEVDAERDVLRAKLTSREEDLAEAQERLQEVRTGQGRDAERMEAELGSLRSELEEADATIAAGEENRSTLERQLEELSRQLAGQAAELAERDEQPSGADPAALQALEEELEELRGTVARLQAELEEAGAAAASAGGGRDLAPVRDLFQRVNDAVSGWKNNFMLVGNYLLGLQNGLDVLRDARSPDQQQAAMAEIDRAGNIEEMQDLLRVCEDDARRMKREILRLRDVLRD